MLLREACPSHAKACQLLLSSVSLTDLVRITRYLVGSLPQPHRRPSRDAIDMTTCLFCQEVWHINAKFFYARGESWSLDYSLVTYLSWLAA